MEPRHIAHKTKLVRRIILIRISRRSTPMPSKPVYGAVLEIRVPLQLEGFAVRRIGHRGEQSTGFAVTSGTIFHHNLVAWNHAVPRQARGGEAPETRAFEIPFGNGAIGLDNLDDEAAVGIGPFERFDDAGNRARARRDVAAEGMMRRRRSSEEQQAQGNRGYVFHPLPLRRHIAILAKFPRRWKHEKNPAPTNTTRILRRRSAS